MALINSQVNEFYCISHLFRSHFFEQVFSSIIFTPHCRIQWNRFSGDTKQNKCGIFATCCLNNSILEIGLFQLLKYFYKIYRTNRTTMLFLYLCQRIMIKIYFTCFLYAYIFSGLLISSWISASNTLFYRYSK